MSIYGAFDISGSGLRAQRVRMDAISANLANQRTPGFKQVMVEFAAGDPAATNTTATPPSSPTAASRAAAADPRSTSRTSTPSHPTARASAGAISAGSASSRPAPVAAPHLARLPR